MLSITAAWICAGYPTPGRERYADIKRAVALDPVDYEAEYDAAMARRDMCAGNSFG